MTIIYAALTNSMRLVDDRIISVLDSCAHVNNLNPMRTAVPIAVERERAICDLISQGAEYKKAKEATVKMVTEPGVISMISAGLTQCDELISSIAKYVARTVRREEGNVEQVTKEEPKI